MILSLSVTYRFENLFIFGVKKLFIISSSSLTLCVFLLTHLANLLFSNSLLLTSPDRGSYFEFDYGECLIYKAEFRRFWLIDKKLESVMKFWWTISESVILLLSLLWFMEPDDNLSSGLKSCIDERGILRFGLTFNFSSVISDFLFCLSVFWAL